MTKRLHNYVKYTSKELDSYTKTESSCVCKVNTNLHLSVGPYCLADFKHAVLAHITLRKVGKYDEALHGIVLDIKNVKILGKLAALRADDSRLHVNINADCYVFRPEAGAILSGVVKHIGRQQVGVIIYRVFNASIRLAAKVNTEEVQMDQEVQFRIRNFNLQNVFPYIEGELLGGQTTSTETKITKLESNDSAIDSGIEEKEKPELDELLTLLKQESDDMVENEATPSKKQRKHKTKIKHEKVSETEETPEKQNKEKSKATKRKGSDSSEYRDSMTCEIKIENESPSSAETTTKRRRKVKIQIT